jgi:hypothetical protein
MGSHYEFHKSVSDGSKTTVKSHFSEGDFTAFQDEGLSSEDVGVESETEHVIEGGKISSVYGETSVVLNQGDSGGMNEDDTVTKIIVEGTHELSGFAQGNDANDLPDFSSAEELEEKNPKYHRSPKFPHHIHHDPDTRPHHTPYKRPPRKEKKTPEKNEERLDNLACPGNINLCKSFSLSKEVGSPDAGLRLELSAMAGVTKGCSDQKRSYMIGAYADVYILVVGKQISAVSAYAEYGQVEGNALKNGIGVSLFGNSVYSTSFPYLSCMTKTHNIAKFSQDFSISYTIVVYIVTINFNIGLTIGFTADLIFTLCLGELKANVSFVPHVTATLHGGAEVSIVVAKAGVEIAGTVGDYVDPGAYVDGSLCRIGFVMSNTVDPFTVSLSAYWMVREVKWKGFIPIISWGSKHSYTIWTQSWGGKTDKLIDIYYSAK